MRRLSSVALTLLLAGAGSSLVGLSALMAALGMRQAVRAAPFHPIGAVAGLLALPVGALLWLLAGRRLDAIQRAAFQRWQLSEP